MPPEALTDLVHASIVGCSLATAAPNDPLRVAIDPMVHVAGLAAAGEPDRTRPVDANSPAPAMVVTYLRSAYRLFTFPP